MIIEVQVDTGTIGNTNIVKVKKNILPERLDSKSTSYSSFDMNISLSTNDEVEIRTTKSKERITAARHNERIGTREIKSSNSGKSIRAGEIIHKRWKKLGIGTIL